MQATETTLIAPELKIQLSGKATSNLAEFREVITAGLATINMEPSSSEEYGEAVENVKRIQTLESAVTDAKDKALKEAEDIHAILTGLDECNEEMRQVRLALEKKIKSRKEEIKQEIVQAGIDELICEKRLRIPTFGSKIKGAISGKKTEESMRKAVDVQVACINAIIEKNRKVIDEFKKEHKDVVLHDTDDLEVLNNDKVEAELRRRLDAYKHAQEKARLEEAATKAKVEAAAAKAMADVPKAKQDGLFGDPDAGHGQTSLVNTAPADPTDDLPDPEAKKTEVDVDLEWQWIRDQVMDALGQLKPVGPKIKAPENQAKFEKFRTAVAAAWKEVY